MADILEMVAKVFRGFPGLEFFVLLTVAMSGLSWFLRKLSGLPRKSYYPSYKDSVRVYWWGRGINYYPVYWWVSKKKIRRLVRSAKLHA